MPRLFELRMRQSLCAAVGEQFWPHYWYTLPALPAFECLAGAAFPAPEKYIAITARRNGQPRSWSGAFINVGR